MNILRRCKKCILTLGYILVAVSVSFDLRALVSAMKYQTLVCHCAPNSATDVYFFLFPALMFFKNAPQESELPRE